MSDGLFSNRNTVNRFKSSLLLPDEPYTTYHNFLVGHEQQVLEQGPFLLSEQPLLAVFAASFQSGTNGSA
jgi:hypothetical protein